MLLVAERLTKTYAHRRGWSGAPGRDGARDGVRPALADASISLARGESVGIVGESGSGKSTLARCLALLERPDTGRVLLDGIDLTRLGAAPLRRMRRRIQVVFQDPYSSLNPRLTVGSALGEVLRVHRLVARHQVAQRVAMLLDQVGMPAGAAERYPSDFSGGQRQRICIARALAAEPQVLIADEPVSALDVSIQAQILNLLADLRAQLALSMIFISHDLAIVRYIAPQIAVMFGGRIVEVLPPGMPLEQAQHPYTQALLESRSRLEPGWLTQGRDLATDLAASLPAAGCPFRERCPRAFAPCRDIDPPALDIGRGHLVACHHVANAYTGSART
jgi:oligopeptide/dipeptide ABC transporter ATP-binding protein